MQKVTLRRIFHYYWIHAKKYRLLGGAVFLLYAIGTLLNNIAIPLIYKNVIDFISSASPDALNGGDVMYFVYIMGGALIVLNIAYRGSGFLYVFIQSKTLFHLSNYSFQRLQKHSYGFFSNNFSGALVTKTKRYIKAYDALVDALLWGIFPSFVQVTAALLVLLYFSPLIGGLYLIWFIIYLVIIVIFVRWQLPYDLVEANADSQVTARYADVITNVLAIKMFASVVFERRQFGKVTQEEESRRRVAWNMHMVQNVIQGTLFGLLQFLMLYVVIKLWLAGQVSIGMIALVQLYVIATFNAVWNIGKNIMAIEKALADAREMVEIFEEKPSVQDVANPEACQIREGGIEFESVAFQYENKQQYILSDFSLSIKSGEKIGLVGHSGAGKTTITKILLRFADISGGEVLIDGQSIRKIKQDDLRRNISYVPQDPLLFHRSLKENIAYGKPSATQEEIVEVAKKAHAHEFIEKLPKGYDTLVGERGVKLSGGERQRVAIARAMLKDAPILILDEATSSLDSVSERHIQEALDELMKGKTTIVVAHRLSTIQKMDRIIVIEEGNIVEEGKHDELLAQSGVYAEFWKQQSGAFIGE